MELLGIPILNAVAYLPLAGFFLILLLPKTQETLIKWVANVTGLLGFLVSVPLITSWYDTQVVAGMQNGMRYTIDVPWIQSLGVRYSMGIDGISLLLVLLTTMLGSVAILSSWSAITVRVKEYYAYLLLLQTGMLGVFMATDLFLFYIFWEVMLVPMYFLIGVWGGPRKEYAAIKFFLYTLAGSVLMLLAIIGIYYNSAPSTLVDGSPTAHTLNIVTLAAQGQAGTFLKAAPVLGFAFTKIVFVALFIGFAIKIPMFPFHTWLPDAHVEAPTPISVILAGVLLKMGPYGILRFNYALLPDATAWAANAIAIFGMINIVYAAFVCLAQKDLKKLIAYSSVSHMGFTLLGMAAMTPTAISGAVLNLFTHGIISPMLFLVVGVIYDRAHHREIERFGGLASELPEYSGIMGLAFFASLGLPGLAGFISEFMVLSGSFPIYMTYTIISATSVIITAAYYLWAIHRMFLGKLNPAYKGFPDLNWRERFTLYPLGAIAIVLGFYPQAILGWINPSLFTLIQNIPRI